ncbi:hypothetical protein A7Q09_01460 [Methylacidiphilum sp. Yel]|nr:hypothetical protein A7Q09_01460 [Methylacidiphilum sp. Yel]
MNKKKYKLLLSSYYFWPQIGGMETFAQLLAQELEKKKHFYLCSYLYTLFRKRTIFFSCDSKNKSF